MDLSPEVFLGRQERGRRDTNVLNPKVSALVGVGQRQFRSRPDSVVLPAWTDSAALHRVARRITKSILRLPVIEWRSQNTPARTESFYRS
jgi:hypothetical protein